MKIDGNYDTYIIYSEKVFKNTVRFSLFAGAYWIWCLFWFGIALYNIVINHNYAEWLISGVIHVLCLFLATLWIEDLINDH